MIATLVLLSMLSGITLQQILSSVHSIYQFICEITIHIYDRYPGTFINAKRNNITKNIELCIVILFAL